MRYMSPKSAAAIKLANLKRKAQGIKRNIFVCKNCNKAYIRWRRSGDEGKTFCSKDCAYKYRAKTRKPRKKAD